MEVTLEMRRGAIRIFELAFLGDLQNPAVNFTSGGSRGNRHLGYIRFSYPVSTRYYFRTVCRLKTILSSLGITSVIIGFLYFEIPDTLESRTKLESFGQLSEEEFRAIEHFLSLGGVD